MLFLRFTCALALCLLTTSLIGQQTASEILSAADRAATSATLRYTLTTSQGYPAPIPGYAGEMTVERDTADPIGLAYRLQLSAEEVEIFYFDDTLRIVFPATDSTDFYPLAELGYDQIDRGLFRHVLQGHFLPDYYRDSLGKSPGATVQLIDSVTDRHVIKVNKPDTEFIWNRTATYTFDTATHRLLRYQSDYETETGPSRDVQEYAYHPDPTPGSVRTAYAPYRHFTLTDAAARHDAAKRSRPKEIAVGDTLPAFEALVRELDLPENSAHYLIDFWYLSCPPCLKLTPIIQELYADREQYKLSVAGINLFDEEALGKRYKEKKEVGYPTLYASAHRERYAVYGHPRVLLTDPRGVVLQVYDHYYPELGDDVRRDALARLEGR